MRIPSGAARSLNLHDNRVRKQSQRDLRGNTCFKNGGRVGCGAAQSTRASHSRDEVATKKVCLCVFG